MGAIIYIYLFAAVFLTASLHNSQGQREKISSKLDFDEIQENNNSSLPGLSDGKGRSNLTDAGETGGSSTATSGSGGNGGKTGPKIHGVRVTVDTGENQNTSKESKESVEITESGKHKKRVGIHTDITFEISGDVDDSNATSTGQRHDKEDNDASVPIYKGRESSSNKPRKPYDPKLQWNPNVSSERRGLDNTGNGRDGSSVGGKYPLYPESASEDRRSGSNVYRSIDNWSNFVPITSVWTTERSYYEPYRSNTLSGYRIPSWKPCYCMSSAIDSRRRRDNTVHFTTARPTSSIIQIVDSKLEHPFLSGRR